MGFGFHKRLRLRRGPWINLWRTGASLAITWQELTSNIGRKGVRKSVGLPGPGLSYRTKLVKLGKSMTPARVVTTLAIVVIIRALLQAR
jgi:Protein of unknown function (DUF4236)